MTQDDCRNENFTWNDGTPVNLTLWSATSPYCEYSLQNPSPYMCGYIWYYSYYDSLRMEFEICQYDYSYHNALCEKGEEQFLLLFDTFEFMYTCLSHNEHFSTVDCNNEHIYNLIM